MRRGALNRSCSDTSQSLFFFFTSHNDNCGELHVDADNVAGVSLARSTMTTIAKVDLQDRLKPLRQIAPGRAAIVVILSYYSQCCYFLQRVRAVS